MACIQSQRGNHRCPEKNQKKSKDKFKQARVNKKVCAGDTVKTGSDARAKIEMADGNEINLSPESQLLIEQYERNAANTEKKVLLNVLYGKIRSNVKEKYEDNDNSHYRVKTKSAVAGVRGTEFLTSFNRVNNQTRVVTFEGEVAVGVGDIGILEEEVPAVDIIHITIFVIVNTITWNFSFVFP